MLHVYVSTIIAWQTVVYAVVFSTCRGLQVHLSALMGEGFILLTRGYGFMGGVYHPPFDTLKKCTSAYDMNLKLYR